MCVVVLLLLGTGGRKTRQEFSGRSAMNLKLKLNSVLSNASSFVVVLWLTNCLFVAASSAALACLLRAPRRRRWQPRRSERDVWC